MARQLFIATWALFSSLIFLSGMLAAQTPNASPSFDEVIEHVSTYLPALNADDGLQKYSLAKRRDGWFYQTEKYNGTDWTITESKLCWSAATKKFVVTDGTNSEIESDEVKKSILNYGVQRYDFDHENYYGYRGWTDDVINFLKDSAKLCDANLEALARAYASEALYRVDQWSDFAVPGRKMQLQEQAGHMTQAQMDTLRKYEHLSIKTYGRLYKQNPNYETKVGGIFCKYSNEIMSTYLMLAYYQNEKEARKELKDGLYDNFTLAFAKNLLNSCDHIGILFTQGDNDTYPLYYLQAHDGFRKDVLIVNNSLLNTARYINYVRSGVFDAPPFPLTIDTSAYAGDSLSYLRKTDEKFGKLVEATGLDFTPDAEVLYKSDIMFLNMIAANNWQRPVYISMTASPDIALNMDEYFIVEGLTYRLTKTKSGIPKLYSARVNTAFSYPFLTNRFEVTDWSKEPYITDDINWVTRTYQGVFARAAATLNDEDKGDECVAVLNRYQQLFPENKIPYSAFMVDMPDLYAKSKHPTEGKALAGKLIKMANSDFDAHIHEGKKEGFNTWNRNMQETLYVLQALLPFVKEHFTEGDYAEKYEKDFNAMRDKYTSALAELAPAK